MAAAGYASERAVPTVEFTAASQSAPEGAVTMTATVQLSATTTADVDVPFTIGGTAVDPDDYTITTSPVTIPMGATTADITITLVGDALDEADETVVLTLGTPTNADLGTTAVHTATVQDDDPTPTVEFSAASQQVSEGDGSTLVIVQLSAASGLEVTVPFTVGGTASTPGDYALPGSAFVIPPGMTSDDVTLTIFDNLANEGDETVELTLGAPTNAAPGGVLVHTVTIQDDDPQPTVEFTASGQVLNEGDPPVTVTVNLSAASELDVTVPFTVSGTAVLLADYTLSGSPFFIPAGGVSDSIQVIAVPDALHEPSETVQLDLAAPTNAGLGAITSNTTTIVDDDPEPTVSFSLLRQSALEDAGVVAVEVQLSAVSGSAVTVDFTAGGTATDPGDFTLTPAAPGPLTIPAGVLTKNIDVHVVDDLDASEGPESVVLTMQSATGATLDPIMFRSAVMIEDNDSPTWNTNTRGLQVDVTEIPFDAERVGEASDPVTVTVTNQQFVPISFNGIHSIGLHPDDFDVEYPGVVPVLLMPGQTTTFDVAFAPTEGGNRRSRLVVQQTPNASPKTRIPVLGTAYGPTGDEIRVNAFVDPYVDAESNIWIPDYGLTGTTATFSVVQPIANTTEDALYQRQRGGQAFSYAFDLPDGIYEVVLHFAETLNDANGARVFDVSIEGAVVLDDFDIRQTAGYLTAHQETFTVTVADGQLDVGFVSSSGEAALAAMEVFSIPIVAPDTTTLDFGTVGQGAFVDLALTLTNTGLDTGTIETVSFIPPPTGHVAGHDFSVLINGEMLHGDHSTITYPVYVPIAPQGGQEVFTVTFEPTEEEVNDLTLRLEGNFGVIDVNLLGTGDHNLDWGFLHPVITVVPDLLVDYDGDLQESAQLLGSESHTHEPGVSLIAWEWSEGGLIFSTDPDTSRAFDAGDTLIELTIKDDDTPQGVATVGETVSVYPPDAVPGILEYLYDGGGGDLSNLMDNLPAQVDFIHRVSSLQALAENGFIRETPYSGDVVVRWIADFVVDQVADYDFQLTGGDDTRLFVDGLPVTGVLAGLGVGTHTLDARFAVPALSDLPLFLVASIDGVVDPGFGTDLVHDENGVVPVIHDMTAVGSELGGTPITIDGFGFYPYDQVTVDWGTTIDLTIADFTTITSTKIEFLAPPYFGVTTIPVSVTTPAGTSNFMGFTYSPDVVPNTFVSAGNVPTVRGTTGAWGPDGRFYVGTLHGAIYAITFDDDYVGTSQVYNGIQSYTNDDILGIAFNPYDPPSPVKLYVAHAQNFAHQNGACVPPGEFAAYLGAVTVLTGPNFDNPVTLISNLPVSNHDHAINGMEFDNNGDLLICVGGNTNAGVTNDCADDPTIGGLPESPLTAAILRAATSRPDFNGQLSYVETDTGIPNNDQVFGDIVDLAPGTHVEVFSPGHRNAYDLVLTTWNYIYATDNGPNSGFGLASTGPNTDSGTQPQDSDEVNLIEWGAYYGHPNRNRGRYYPRENVYHGGSGPSIPGEFTQRIQNIPSSTDGIVEYRANTFNGQMRGELLAQKWNGPQHRLKLSADKRHVVADTLISPTTTGLDVQVGPGGAILVVEYTSNGGKVKVLVPDDAAAIGLTVYDIFPWRAPSTGGTPFVIGGFGFGTLADTSVTIGGIPATLTSVTPQRIRGIVPVNPSPTTDLVDVQVFVGVNQKVLPQAFRYLFPVAGTELGFWTSGLDMPDDVGEVACGVIGGIMYLVGEGTNKTLAYDILNDSWADNLPVRPFTGHHHAAEIIDGKFYLFGRLGGIGGKVQWYDPGTNSWSVGATMPWNGGSIATCQIDGMVYAAGGIVGSSTVANVWRYDPSIDQWDANPLPSLPTPVNHAASATDGQKFYIFGGRGGGNTPQPGYDTVQIYDPVTDTWDSSDLPASTIAPMPHGKGGTGNAVYYQGEFYVFGGETNDGSDALADPGLVFPQVYVYDPAANSWREELRMPTARHGIFPVLFQSRMFLAGGGVVAGNSQTDILEIFSRY